MGPGKREMLLEVLPGGAMIRLNDPRGSGVQGCILDTDALARAAMAFRQAALDRPDLLLAGRFGKEEAAGGGMRAEIAETLLAGVPLLVPVRADLLADWQAFLGAPSEVLAPAPPRSWRGPLRSAPAARCLFRCQCGARSARAHPSPPSPSPWPGVSP